MIVLESTERGDPLELILLLVHLRSLSIPPTEMVLVQYQGHLEWAQGFLGLQKMAFILHSSHFGWNFLNVWGGCPGWKLDIQRGRANAFSAH